MFWCFVILYVSSSLASLSAIPKRCRNITGSECIEEIVYPDCDSSDDNCYTSTSGRSRRQASKCNRCTYPEHPNNGRYKAIGTNDEPFPITNGVPGDSFDYISLNVTCDPGFEVDGKATECTDGKWSGALPKCVIGATTTSAPVTTGQCVIPAHPAYGRYNYFGILNAEPGKAFDFVYFNVSCDPGYGPLANHDVYCMKSVWNSPLPQCTRYCKIVQHPSIEYKCLVEGENSLRGTKKCNEYEPHGTTVIPECRSPNYFFSGILPHMHCVYGSWDHAPICKPECGRVTPVGRELVINGRQSERGELPWHVAVYMKAYTPYLQICGGTLISNKIVISAAHCFWNPVTKKQPASDYSVAVGKIYRPWNNKRDTDAQKSDVAGWGLTAANGKASRVLNVATIPFVPLSKCEANVPAGYLEYLTPDKICAGYTNGTALCKGDSGGGFAFPEWDRGVERFYLRGVVSTTPTDQNLCNVHAITSFTNIIAHKEFIKQYIQVN